MASVKFPTPLHPLITRDILVETYEVRVRFCLSLTTSCPQAGDGGVVLICKAGRGLGVVEGLPSMCKAGLLPVLQEPNLLYAQTLGGAGVGEGWRELVLRAAGSLPLLRLLTLPSY